MNSQTGLNLQSIQQLLYEPPTLRMTQGFHAGAYEKYYIMVKTRVAQWKFNISEEYIATIFRAEAELDLAPAFLLSILLGLFIGPEDIGDTLLQLAADKRQGVVLKHGAWGWG
jgi:hypothetical protein